ncbi:PHA/PHB synthase family protein [Azohydromonas aeria]|uniref:PHA/PHB synthase family protein n=1 Tax=Azohydromonas aeria TaxID=2590212 RepID=UPI0012FAE4B5|nr:poly-beta-hydroxybutyrate polymerase N-terminal domain-containing protein [Azohydromonas aeria]
MLEESPAAGAATQAAVAATAPATRPAPVAAALPAPRAAATELPAAQHLDQAAHALLSRAAMGLSPISLTLAWADWALHLAASPGRLATLAQEAARGAAAALPAQPGTPARPESDDRFRDPAWAQWPYAVFKDQYKAACAWWEQAVQVDGVSRHHAQLVSFFTRQALDALSPSNFAATNPLVAQAARETGGQNFVKGLQLLAQDLAQQATKGDAADAAAALQPLPFAVGRDVAVTPGKVVYRNHLIELIRYEPTTATVHPEPVLIVPSCIMKYYILDLSPGNSMVRYLVGQGHTVYIISWRNPEAADRDLGLRDYLHSGVMDAMAAVGRTSGATKLHAAGYCLGGTFLSIVAAALAGAKARGDAQPHRRHTDTATDLPELASVTLLTTLTDFTEPGELGVFIDDDQLRTLREEMARTGYLSGKQMSGSFQLMGSRDLIWSRNLRRYALGQDDKPMDLMSWNADATRLPERMHSEYLQSLYLNNALATGRYRVGDAAVALSDLHMPLFVVGTARDHVAPWKSVYKIHLLTDTDTTFVLASGGHNAGIVSEPGRPRRGYQIAERRRGQAYATPEDYVNSAPAREGSWWEAWSAWLAERSGERVAAQAIPAEQAIEDAPGRYVHVRHAD